VRQIDDKFLLDIMYTGVGEDFEKYRSDAMAMMKQVSSF
jgi:hypothetical protein